MLDFGTVLDRLFAIVAEASEPVSQIVKRVPIWGGYSSSRGDGPFATGLIKSLSILPGA